MRRAVIADIHGNSIALEAVLRDCEAERVDEIVCLGDMIGFLPAPIDCVDLVRKNCLWSLSGDHELSLFMNEISRNRIANNSLAIQRRALKPRWYSGGRMRSSWKWLESLEPKKTYTGALFVHASPLDPIMEYILPVDFTSPASQKMIDNFNAFDGLCFGGHTHIPGIARNEMKWHRPEEFDGMKFHLEASAKTFINVGSVGQPRDTNPKSCYVIWDDAEKTILFRRVSYDIAALKKRFAAMAEVDAFYYERLEKGS